MKSLLRTFLVALILLVVGEVLAAVPIPIPSPGFASTPQAAGFRAICTTVLIEGGEDLPIGAMEKRLLCGDPEKDVVGEPWAAIPPNEAAFFMTSFLQSHGYHKPVFLQDGARLFVRAGEVSRLDHFIVKGGPKTWDPPRRRLIRGLPLTPQLLDDLQGWSLAQIKDEGYACPTAETRADPETGEVVVFLDPGQLTRIASVDDEGDPGLRTQALDRYNAFRIGDVYRQRLITLTRRRTVEDAFLQTLTLSPQCENGSVHIARNITLGSGRQLRVGFGGSTETGARVRVIARQSRVGSSASSLEARLDASFVQQVADASARWYYSRGEARSYIEPVVIFNRQVEPAFETQSMTTKLLHGYGWEESTGQADVRIGPNLLFSKSIRGAGPESSTVALIETTARWINHDFEFFSTSPRAGEFLEATGLFTFKRWGASFTAQKFELRGEKLWNLFRYDPPLFILGLRFNVSSVFSSDPNITSDLPVQFLSFAGGEQTLRGFERQALPRDSVGSLSGAIGGAEARFHKVILAKADAFTFVDAGALGGVRFKLENPIFVSPGFGVRWESPVGVFRAYAAERFAVNEIPGQRPYDRKWRLGLTYGEEF